jgi:hypothetical protein
MLLALHAALALAAMGLALAAARGRFVPVATGGLDEARSAQSGMAKRMAAFQPLSIRFPYAANP